MIIAVRSRQAAHFSGLALAEPVRRIAGFQRQFEGIPEFVAAESERIQAHWQFAEVSRLRLQPPIAVFRDPNSRTPQ
jgi:hypothetical protein